jgi:hypothetical protein
VSVKPVLDTLCDCAAYVSCSVSLFQVHLKMNQKPVSPLCSGLAAGEERSRFHYIAGIVSRTTASRRSRTQWVTSHD